MTAPTSTMLVVPAGAERRRCRHCNRAIYLGKDAKGHGVPVDCSVPGGRRPFVPVPGDGKPQDGLGAPHMPRCPIAPKGRSGT
jgi:hypothetical protein